MLDHRRIARASGAPPRSVRRPRLHASALVARSAEELERLAAELGDARPDAVVPLPADVGDRAQVEGAVGALRRAGGRASTCWSQRRHRLLRAVPRPAGRGGRAHDARQLARHRVHGARPCCRTCSTAPADWIVIVVERGRPPHLSRGPPYTERPSWRRAASSRRCGTSCRAPASASPASIRARSRRTCTTTTARTSGCPTGTGASAAIPPAAASREEIVAAVEGERPSVYVPADHAPAADRARHLAHARRPDAARDHEPHRGAGWTE